MTNTAVIDDIIGYRFGSEEPQIGVRDPIDNQTKYNNGLFR
jgi:hypothetical protein